ncbi:MAG: tyrosine--tRNA ligase [Elusimicrobia bacterium]|nr:tyrosine--tRNA ligase [Elusimicrobiota bacterium]
MSAIPEIIRRGVVALTSDAELSAKLARGKPLRVKLGVDPTARDLHLGHTVPLRKMRQFQDLGHTGVLIIGDFTARVGDPSGRSELRPVLRFEEIKANAATYQEQAFKILDPKRTELRFNSEWLEPFVNKGELLGCLQKVTHAQLTEREDFKLRIKENKPITMLEILYPIFQGYDSVAIKADVELGATDQTFNLLFGRQMQRDYSQEPQVTLTLPIILGTDGARKMSKSYGNAVAIQDDAGEMFGKTMSVSDQVMFSWAEVLTGLDLAAMKKMHPMQAKKLLAEAIVSWFYGVDAAVLATAQFDRVHSKGELPDEMPEFKLPYGTKLSLSQVLQQSGLLKSRKEAQRKILEGSVRIDGAVIKEDRIIQISSPIVLTFGKRGFLRLAP